MNRDLSKGQKWVFAVACYIVGFPIQWYWAGGIAIHVELPRIEDWPSLAVWLLSPLYLGVFVALPLAWLAGRVVEPYLEMRARAERAERRADYLADELRALTQRHNES